MRPSLLLLFELACASAESDQLRIDVTAWSKTPLAGFLTSFYTSAKAGNNCGASSISAKLAMSPITSTMSPVKPDGNISTPQRAMSFANGTNVSSQTPVSSAPASVARMY